MDLIKKETFLQRYFTKHDFFGWFLGVNGGMVGGWSKVEVFRETLFFLL